MSINSGILGFLICFFSMMGCIVSAQEVLLEISKDAAYFLENKDSVLAYRAMPKSLNGTYSRANYIHPVYGLDGYIITEDFPEDHLHHRGIFWAWHQLYVGKTRIGDGWELKDIYWDVISMAEVNQEVNSCTLKSEVLWKSPLWKDDKGTEKPLVLETTSITVHPREDNYRIIDIEIDLLALESEMSLGGSEDDKGYGGFSIRMKLADDIQFEDKKGQVIPQNLPVDGMGWLSISGNLDNKAETTGITVIPHEDNPDYPNPWILRDTSSMQNAVYPHPGATPIALSKESPTILKYRLLISKEKLNNDLIERVKDSFFLEK